MKRTSRYLYYMAVVVLFFCFASLPCHAKEVIDHCDGRPVPGAVYEGWVPKTTFFTTGKLEFPDKTGLAIADAQTTGMVTYQVPKATAVAVDFFTANATYAVEEEAGVLSYNSKTAGNRRPLWFSPSTGKVYCKNGQTTGWELMVAEWWMKYFFSPKEVPLPGDLVPLGLNIFASADGVQYTAVDMVHQLGKRYSADGDIIYYDKYRAILPEGTNFVRLVVNHIQVVVMEGRGESKVEQPTPSGLLSVVVTALDETVAPQEQGPSQDQMPKPTASAEKPKKPDLRPHTTSSKTEEHEPEGVWDSFGGNTSPVAPVHVGSVTGSSSPVKEKSEDAVQENESNGGEIPEIATMAATTKTAVQESFHEIQEIVPTAAETDKADDRSRTSPFTIALGAAAAGAFAALLLVMASCYFNRKQKQDRK